MEDFKELFVENSRKIIADFKRDILVLKSDPKQSAIIENIHRYAHSIKGLSAMMEFNEINEVSNALEIMLGEAIKGARDLNGQALLEIENGFAKIERLLEDAG